MTSDESAPHPKFPLQRTDPLNVPPEYDRLRSECPVSRVTLWDGSHPWLVTRYEDVRSVLGDVRFSSDFTRAGYPAHPRSTATRSKSPNFIAMDPPEHDRYRAMLAKYFTIRRVTALRPNIEILVDRLLEDMGSIGPPADVIGELALPLPSLVICQLLGVPYEDHAFFHRCSQALMRHDGDVNVALEALQELLDYFDRILDVKRREPGEDLLSGLLREQVDSGALSRSDLVDMARQLLSAGHETTANMIGLGTLVLLQHPDQCKEMVAGEDTELVANAVEEMLRYFTITQFGRRRVATEDVWVGGQKIAAGDGVIAAEASANHDEEAFDHSSCFDIRREARHHLAFGYGIHQCLGQQLARAELQIVFPKLFRRFPSLRLAQPVSELEFKDDTFLYGVKELLVAW